MIKSKEIDELQKYEIEKQLKNLDTFMYKLSDSYLFSTLKPLV